MKNMEKKIKITLKVFILSRALSIRGYSWMFFWLNFSNHGSLRASFAVYLFWGSYSNNFFIKFLAS